MQLVYLQEVNFYNVIDYILHGKEEIKVLPWVISSMMWKMELYHLIMYVLLLHPYIIQKLLGAYITAFDLVLF